MSDTEIQDFEKGIRLFNARAFYECHDTFEELWKEAGPDNRAFLQGLIQSAVAYYHQSTGNFKGAESQISKAIEKLERYPNTQSGIDLESFIRTLRLHRSVFRSVLSMNYNASLARELTPPEIHYI